MISLSTVGEARDLVKRFGGFFDAVLVDVHLSLPRAMGSRYGAIKLLACEADAVGADGWRTVVLRLDVLHGYRLTEGPGSYQVLSEGLHISQDEEDTWILDLSPSSGARASGAGADQYMSGRKCSYDIVDVVE